MLITSPLAIGAINVDTHVDLNDIQWTLEKDKKAIQVYSGKEKSSGLTAYKAVAEINAPLYQLFNLLQDNSVTTNWLFNLKSILPLEKRAYYETDYYVIYSTPWPVADSSAVLRATWQYDNDNKVLFNSTVSIAAGKYSDDGYLHIPLIETHNHFQQLGDNKVKIVFQVVVDNGYAIPGLIVDTVAVDTLYKTMKNLKNTDYQPYSKTDKLSNVKTTQPETR